MTGKKKHSLWVRRLVTGASVTAVLLLWMCSASVFIRPSALKGIGIVGMGFPVFLAGVLVMLVLSLLLAPRRSWIPILGLVLCSGSIRSYFPLNFPKKAPERCLKVMSYNIEMWGGNDIDTLKDSYLPIAQYIGRERPDIVCLQEAMSKNKDFYEKYIFPEIPYKLYHDSVCLKNISIALLSRYPIVDRRILSRNECNQAVAFWVKMSPNDTLVVVNCHLMSMHLSENERTGFSNLMHRKETDIPESMSRSILSKLYHSGLKRADMVDSVANFVKQYRKGNLILCGDFNDTPISYTRQRIASQLTDAYRATANGLGRSFNRYAMMVRIDYMFCSSQWEPYDCHIDNHVDYSDHYPIISYFKRKKLN